MKTNPGIESTEHHFTVDARAMLQLGRESIKDHSTALVELVKNCYDADATDVTVSISSGIAEGSIVVVDNGIGMSADDVIRRWLRIGYSEKLRESLSAKKRRQTGEKGIGRISADRLGSRLTLRSRTRTTPLVEIDVNWERFDVPGTDLASIPISVRVGDLAPLDPEHPELGTHGTYLRIDALRQRWSKRDLASLYDELAFLVSPFGKVDDFRIVLSSNLEGEFNGPVRSPMYDLAEVELQADFDGRELTYSIADRAGRRKDRPPTSGTMAWEQLVQRSGSSEADARARTGKVTVRLLMYLRSADATEGTTLHLADLRDFLNRHAGIKIYRDQVRVRPYGDPTVPEGDWLGLDERRSGDPAGVGRRTYKFAANQVVGAVLVGRDTNPALIDGASREGLVHSEAFADLRALVLGCVSLMEAHRHEAYQESSVAVVGKDPVAGVTAAASSVRSLRTNLRLIRKHLPAHQAKKLERALEDVDTIGREVETAKEGIEEALAEAGVLRGLASLGIAASVFGHETQSAIAAVLSSTTLARELLTDSPPDVALVLEELAKTAKGASQVSAWGSFALSRVNRDKRRRRKIAIKQTVEGVVRDLTQPFESAGIQLHTDLSSITAKTFEMDVEAVLLNLLTNAYLACLQRKRREVRVSLAPEARGSRNGYLITVADSGPGVPRDLRKKIWQPLFTTRRDPKGRENGTGLGLSIVKSVVDDLKGEAVVDADATLGGARFAIWLPEK